MKDIIKNAFCYSEEDITDDSSPYPGARKEHENSGNIRPPRQISIQYYTSEITYTVTSQLMPLSIKKSKKRNLNVIAKKHGTDSFYQEF